METVDFDFGRYVALRKGAKQAQRREGLSYAFSADLRMLRKIERASPVETVLQEAGRLFQGQAQKDLLASARLVSREQDAAVVAAVHTCAERLHIAPPSVYITSEPKEPGPVTLGALEEAYILFPANLAKQLSEAELLFAIGSECGRIQNGHIPLRTALFYVTHVPKGFVRLVIAPAKAILSVWLRRANITADRAGLLCSRSVESSQSALRKMLVNFDPTERVRRESALLRFAESQYFRTLLNLPGGESQESCDEAVAILLDEKPTHREG